MSDCHLRERLAIEQDILLLHSFDETRVRDAVRPQRGIEADDPETAEIALLDTTILVRIHAGADDGLIRLHVGRTAHAAVPLRECANFLVSAMPNDTSLDAHDLEIGEETSDRSNVRGMSHDRTRETLLALVLLREKVIAAVTPERVRTASGLPDALLGAAVGLELGHGDGEV